MEIRATPEATNRTSSRAEIQSNDRRTRSDFAAETADTPGEEEAVDGGKPKALY